MKAKGIYALVMVLGLAVQAVVVSSAALGQAIVPGFDGQTLPPNDDASSGLVSLGFSGCFFGIERDSLYVNNNGNVTFDSPMGTYTPFDLTSTGREIIAPFFADVDTRNAGSPVTYGLGTYNGRPAFGVNYVDVDYYQSSPQHTNRNSFQVILVDRSDIGVGDVDIVLNYDQIQWEAGNASGGDENGLGGTSARAGYSSGTGAPGTYRELPGSAINGAFIDGHSHALASNSLNSDIAGRYIFEARDCETSVGDQNGTNGFVRGMASAYGYLYVGGSFDKAGNTPANNVARWNGFTWGPLGSGDQNGINGTVHAVVVTPGNQVYVGGEFTEAGGQPANNIARFDGFNWHPVGDGAQNGVNGPVRALKVVGGGVIAGGTFSQAGGSAANNVAQWDGFDWQPLGGGVNGPVHALQVIGGALGSGAGIYAGGSFTSAGGTAAGNVARFDGANWNALGNGQSNGVNGTVNAMEVIGGATGAGAGIYFGGQFTEAGGQAANYIARWDGSAWQALGAGDANGVNGAVRAMAVTGGRLYVGGEFTEAGGAPVNHVARWWANQWQALGGGQGNGVNNWVYSMVYADGNLRLGGEFTRAGGPLIGGRLHWTAPGKPGAVLSGGSNDEDPGVRANYVVNWNGHAWHPLDSSDFLFGDRFQSGVLAED